MSYNEKINIYVPENVGSLINNDAFLFEVLKNDGCTVNRNRFINQLIEGYYNSYVSECQKAYEALQEELTDFIPNLNARSQVAERILYRIILPEVPKRKGKNPMKLSLKPTNDTEGIVRRIMEGLSMNDYVSQYFCRMFMSYAEKPIFEREQIIFKDTYQILLAACEKQSPIAFSTIWDKNTVHEVVPYTMAIGQDEMFNYLLCQEKSLRTGESEARAYRLNRITQMSFSPSIITLSDQVKKYLDRMKVTGAQYPINDDDEICVRLTDYGTISYNRIYHGRPKYDRIEHIPEGHLYYFHCSKDQVFFYFRRFDADAAEIVYPINLRERMIKFHTTAVATYKMKEEKIDEEL